MGADDYHVSADLYRQTRTEKERTRNTRKLAMLIVLLNVVLTPLAIREAYLWRGYWAVGGEWLILPASVYIAWILFHLKRVKREEKAG